MAHQLSTYDANHDHVATTSFEDRADAFAAFDRKCRTASARVAYVELIGDGLNRVHRFDDVPDELLPIQQGVVIDGKGYTKPPEHPDEAPEAPQAGGDDCERPGDAQADAGDAAPAREAAPPPEAAAGARKPASGRASLGPLTAAPRDATKKGR